MMITRINLEKVRDVFAIFHDGTIASWQEDKGLLQLKMECLYLAELMCDTYEYFLIEIRGIEHFVLAPWMNQSNILQKHYVELHDIFQAELEVLYAEVEGRIVKVFCRQNDPSFDFCGGYLYIRSQDISVLDQGGRTIPIDELKALARRYWEKFGSP